MEQRMATTQEYHQCVNRVVEYINNHLGEEIDLERLAEISHFSPYHFHRIMKVNRWEHLLCVQESRPQPDCYVIVQCL